MNDGYPKITRWTEQELGFLRNNEASAPRAVACAHRLHCELGAEGFVPRSPEAVTRRLWALIKDGR